MSGTLSQNLSYVLLGEDRSASKTMTGAARTAEVVTGRIGSAFQRVGGIIGGEFGNVLSSTGNGIDELGSKAAKLSTAMMVGGGVALTAGIGLQQFGSGATQATDQLNAAITASGSATTDYAERIDKAVKMGENFDHSAVDTKNALQVLTQATGDTGKALDTMGVVTNLAAAKHIGLSEAALLVTRVMGGSGARTLVQFGIHMDGVGTKTEQGQRALEELSKKLDGQAKASVNNFGSQVDIVKTKVKDFAEEVAGPVGGALTALGGVSTVAGLALDIYKTKQAAAAAATLAASVATDAAVVSEDALTVSTIGLDGAMDANPIGIVAGVIGGLAAVMGGIALVNANNLTTAEQNYTAALQASNGAIDENVTKIAAKALAESGAYKAANQLGISTSLVLSATLGNKDAQAELTKEIAAQTKELNSHNVVTGNGIIVRTGDTKAIDAQQSALNTLSGAYGTQKQAISEDIAKNDEIQGSMDALAGKIELTTGQVNSLTRAIKSVPSLHVSSSGQVTYSDAKQRATGGIVQPGELTMVGERGPELVRMPGGTQVYPTGTGPAMSGGGSGMTIQISLAGANVYGSPNAYAKALAAEIRTAVLQGHLDPAWASGQG